MNTREITGTAILGALVVVFDYALKFAGIKIPFPMLPFLKFDLDGIPVVLSLLIYGPYSAVTTCFVALVAILARSGDALSASMKALAEFATVLGMMPFYAATSRRLRGLAIILGMATRVVVMAVATLATWPLLFKSLSAVVAFLPFSALFNAVAAVISVVGGFIVYEALRKRAPALVTNANAHNSRGHE
jgi:riboflavin transporter FmnP